MVEHRRSTNGRDVLSEHFKPLATLIADLVVAAMNASTAEATFYTQHNCPLSRRVYLAAARRRAFPNFCVGRTVFCRRQDLHAFIEKCERSTACNPRPSPVDEIGALLDEAGLRSRRGTR